MTSSLILFGHRPHDNDAMDFFIGIALLEHIDKISLAGGSGKLFNVTGDAHFFLPFSWRCWHKPENRPHLQRS